MSNLLQSQLKIGLWGEKMTIYEIPNIEHCTVAPVGNPPVIFRVTAHEGWYIHLNDGIEDTANYYKTFVALNATYPFEQVQIIPASELPEGAEILGGNTEPETETM